MKVKCSFENCYRKISLIGNCKYCNNNYCNIHRLSEMHNCENLNVLINNSKQSLTEKLKRETVPDIKINKL